MNGFKLSVYQSNANDKIKNALDIHMIRNTLKTLDILVYVTVDENEVRVDPRSSFGSMNLLHLKIS